MPMLFLKIAIGNHGHPLNMTLNVDVVYMLSIHVIYTCYLYMLSIHVIYTCYLYKYLVFSRLFYIVHCTVDEAKRDFGVGRSAGGRRGGGSGGR